MEDGMLRKWQSNIMTVMVTLWAINIPVELQHVQCSNIHPLPRSIDIILNVTSCHLNGRRHPLCKPAWLSQKQLKITEKYLRSLRCIQVVETMRKWSVDHSPLDFFKQLRWALPPDSIDEHAIQILCWPICQDDNYMSVSNWKHGGSFIIYQNIKAWFSLKG